MFVNVNVLFTIMSRNVLVNFDNVLFISEVIVSRPEALTSFTLSGAYDIRSLVTKNCSVSSFLLC